MAEVISIVGGGGKTTTMYHFAKKYSEVGKRVIVTTSTHILKNYEFSYFYVDNPDDIRLYYYDFFKENKICVIGVNASDKKIKSLGENLLNEISFLCDILIIEADGAKGLPIKFQGGNEPVIHSFTDKVVIVTGLDCLYKKIKDICFRYELAQEIYGWNKEHILNIDDIVKMLTDDKVLRKGCNDKAVTYILNKADNKELFNAAKEIASRIRAVDKFSSVIITSNSDRDISL